MKTRINFIKRREQFRPFAGSILQNKVQEYFDVPEKNHWSPFMTFCFQVKKDKKNDLAAIIHPDRTCRIQTVSPLSSRASKASRGISRDRYYKLIKKFYKLTGIPCILNTSFNLKGEPVVESPEQAVDDFLKTKMDYLVIGDFLAVK